MGYQLEEIELQMQEVLGKPTTQPKFKMFQKVFQRDSDSLKECQVVGILYVSPAIALFDSLELGWHYTVQVNLTHQVVEESELQEISQ